MTEHSSCRLLIPQFEREGLPLIHRAARSILFIIGSYAGAATSADTGITTGALAAALVMVSEPV